ncbi:hypothetical protein LTS10_006564 [Elasticomyces elasticus]|nr:hypothetical protein LTS10_006564 [Elasticomyces elasticus]
MKETWTADKDQKLLIYAVDLGMINVVKLADMWVEKEGTEVSVSAVRQHLAKLRTKTGVGKATGNGGTPRKAASTPRKTATGTPGKKSASKASANGTKRGRGSMSDEDDDDEEPTMHSGSESPSKRVKMERRSKTPKTYAAPESDDEDLLANHGSTNGSGAEGAANGNAGDLDEDDDAFEPAFH